jgi:hypothetical protein
MHMIIGFYSTNHTITVTLFTQAIHRNDLADRSGRMAPVTFSDGGDFFSIPNGKASPRNATALGSAWELYFLAHARKFDAALAML